MSRKGYLESLEMTFLLDGESLHNPIQELFSGPVKLMPTGVIFKLQVYLILCTM